MSTAEKVTRGKEGERRRKGGGKEGELKAHKSGKLHKQFIVNTCI